MSALLTVPVYLIPAKWLGRRALERKSREQTATLVQLIVTAIRALIPRASVRAIVGFAIASLLRSRRHLLVLATYFGLAIATCVASILIIEVHGTFLINTPSSWVLALPLVFQFFLVMGLRSSFRIPTDMQANWPFRLSQPSLHDALNASVLVMVIMAMLPDCRDFHRASRCRSGRSPTSFRAAGLQWLSGLLADRSRAAALEQGPVRVRARAIDGQPQDLVAGVRDCALQLRVHAIGLAGGGAAARPFAMTSYLAVCTLAIVDPARDSLPALARPVAGVRRGLPARGRAPQPVRRTELIGGERRRSQQRLILRLGIDSPRTRPRRHSAR